MFENIKLLLKSDQIKSRPSMFFSLQFYIQERSKISAEIFPRTQSSFVIMHW